MTLHTKITALPNGAYDVEFENRRYLLRKETLLAGKLIKLYAEELGGNDFISLNYYVEKRLLKPCEMAEEKVTGFIGRLVVV